MYPQDTTRIGHRARRETEAFINNHINDYAKGWPVLCYCSSASIPSLAGQGQHIRRRGIMQTLLTK